MPFGNKRMKPIVAVLSIDFKHPTERTLTSDWCINSFIIVVYEKNVFTSALDRKFCLNFKNNFLIDNYLELFTNQSEVSPLRAVCPRGWLDSQISYLC